MPTVFEIQPEANAFPRALEGGILRLHMQAKRPAIDDETRVMALQQIDPVSENERMGDEGMTRYIELCHDVADVTTLHARMMARDSDYSSDLAATCAELCEGCADECAQHDHDHCQLCADVLQECARSCRDMASA